MNPDLSDLPARLQKWVWAPRERPPTRGRGVALRVVRTALILGRDLAQGQLTLRAMSLVYTTLLSIVPLLALSFSVLKAFGVSNQIEPMLLQFLEPLGEKGSEIARRIVQFIQNMNVGVLGAVGLALLVYTAISWRKKIGESLNYIWHVPRPRRLAERFSRYLSVLIVGPILVFSAVGLTASVLSVDTVQSVLEVGVLGSAVAALGRVMPYVFVIAAFAFIYVLLPNTRVRVGPALVGGAAGGIAWQTAGWAFAIFVASSNRYAAIYSSLAILILFMIWLYLSWLILLFGASVAFYAQHPEYLYARGGEPRLSNRMRERLALAALCLITRRFLAGEPKPTLAELTRELGVPLHVLHGVLDALERAGLLAQSGDETAVFLPGRDPARISVRDVLATVRAEGEQGFLAPENVPVPPSVARLLGRMQEALDKALADASVRDLAAIETRADLSETSES